MDRTKHRRHPRAKTGTGTWLSAGACVCIVGLWVIGGFWGVALNVHRTTWSIEMSCSWGIAEISAFSANAETSVRSAVEVHAYSLSRREAELSARGLASDRHRYGFTMPFLRTGHGNQPLIFHIELPYWLGLICVWAANDVRRYVRRYIFARPKLGCCALCGYDLTGNTSGRCPECGHAAKNRDMRDTGEATKGDSGDRGQP
jgi:hypothetical protein